VVAIKSAKSAIDERFCEICEGVVWTDNEMTLTRNHEINSRTGAKWEPTPFGSAIEVVQPSRAAMLRLI